MRARSTKAQAGFVKSAHGSQEFELQWKTDPQRRARVRAAAVRRRPTSTKGVCTRLPLAADAAPGLPHARLRRRFACVFGFLLVCIDTHTHTHTRTDIRTHKTHHRTLFRLCVSPLRSCPQRPLSPRSSAQRTYDEEMSYVERLTPTSWRIKKGCVPNMKVALPCCLVTVMRRAEASMDTKRTAAVLTPYGVLLCSWRSSCRIFAR